MVIQTTKPDSDHVSLNGTNFQHLFNSSLLFRSLAFSILFIVIAIILSFILIAIIIVCVWRRKSRSLAEQSKNNKSKSSELNKSLLHIESSLGHSPNSFDSEVVHSVLPGIGQCNKASFSEYSFSLTELSQVTNKLKLDNGLGFSKQFSSLHNEKMATVENGKLPINKVKNRFRNILPYDHSRVILDYTKTATDSDYVNANRINNYYKNNFYIASQAPLPNTLYDFWAVIWQYKIEHVVMLTKVNELGKVKCESYWPQNVTDTVTFNTFGIKLVSHKRFTFYEIRIMEVTNSLEPDSSPQRVTQLHYIAWPDHGVPIFSSSLISFIQICKQHHDPIHSITPLLVHCSAGVGRTGTFLALDYILEEIKHNDVINVFQVVSGFRESRCQMVQTLEQYTFIYEALVNHIVCDDTCIDGSAFKMHCNNCQMVDLQTMTSGFESQFDKLVSVSRHVGCLDCITAIRVDNTDKNRDSNFLPFESHRIRLKTDTELENDYINASLTENYNTSEELILAQGPMEHTVQEFWKMILQKKVSLIVMLGDVFADGQETCAVYWPELEASIRINEEFSVIMKSEDNYGDFCQRKFSVIDEKENQLFPVVQLQFLKWEHLIAPDIHSLLGLYHQMIQIQRQFQQPRNSTVMLHCSDGSSRTGVFAACLVAIQQLDLEKKVDIFQIVKNIRSSRTNAISTVNLFTLIHRVVLEYIKAYEENDYSNFQ